MGQNKLIEIEVAYADSRQQQVVRVKVPVGTSLRGAIERSRICALFPEIDLTRDATGVYGELRELDAAVSAGERIEIYSALVRDPKEARRRRAREP